MKFGSTFREYLQEEREWFVDEKCAHVEYIRLKKVLKSCQKYNSSYRDQLCHCQSCPLCDQQFFSELMKDASDVVGYFSSRVHSSVNGENFKSRMHAEHIELLHSPWLIELGAFYLNSSGLDGCELDGVYGHFSCDLDITKAVMTLILPDSIKLEYDLTCAICLDFVFNPYALSCGHIFCKSCACSAASVMIFQGLKAASPESKCPICREVGVYSKAVHMLELDLLMKRRCRESWKERLAGERVDTLKQSKEFWNLQSTYAIGLL